MGRVRNFLSLGECVWCDICNETMGESTKPEEESEAVREKMKKDKKMVRSDLRTRLAD